MPWAGNTSDQRTNTEKVADFDPLSLHPDFLNKTYFLYRLLRENDPAQFDDPETLNIKR